MSLVKLASSLPSTGIIYQTSRLLQPLIGRFSSSGSSHLFNSPTTKISTTSNGVRVASETFGGETATVGVWIDAGSRFETEQNNGVAHFLEHMSFKGTKKRTQWDLELEVENLGAHLNAYTSREQTVYYAKVCKENIPNAVEILSDILQHSKFEKAFIENERAVILREMEEVDKNVEEVVFDHLHETAYSGSSLARTILGPPINIQSINRKDLRQYIESHYHSSRVIVCAAGAVDHDELCKLTEKHFGKLPSGPSAVEALAQYPSQFTPGFKEVIDPLQPYTNTAITVEGVGWRHADYFPLLVMQSMIGQWDVAGGNLRLISSQLSKALAEQDIAISSMAFFTGYTDTGLWGSYVVTLPEHADKVIKLVMAEWKRLSENVNNDEVERAKSQLKANIARELDGSSNICEDIGRQLLTFKRRLTLPELFSRIDLVDADQVKRCALQYVVKRDPAVSVITPTPSMPYDEICKLNS